jgi:ferric-dicitrate binding protein FerR (iron transport regulator)
MPEVRRQKINLDRMLEEMDISENVFRLPRLIFKIGQDELLSYEEENELETWMLKSEGNRQYVTQLKTEGVPASKIQTYLCYEKNKPAAKARVMEQLFPSSVWSLRGIIRRMGIPEMAAAFILLPLLVFGFYQLVLKPSDFGSSEVFNTVVADSGQIRSIKLPDGTKVWLNAASSIKYPAAFTGNERHVYIKGEVYFEVVKDAAKPFRVSIIDQPDKEVKVLGTHFNVKAYPDEPAIQTTLLEGSVMIRNKNQVDTLKPGEQAIVTNNGIAKAMDVDTGKITAWVSSKFNFRNDDIKTIMRELARWYKIEVSYRGEIPGNSFIATIRRDVELSTVLKSLMEYGIKYEINGNKVTIMPSKPDKSRL